MFAGSKLILWLQNCVYPHKYMDNWGKFNEASLAEIEGFYSHSNMDNITDADYSNAKRDCKDFEKKN